MQTLLELNKQAQELKMSLARDTALTRENAAAKEEAQENPFVAAGQEGSVAEEQAAAVKEADPKAAGAKIIAIEEGFAKEKAADNVISPPIASGGGRRPKPMRKMRRAGSGPTSPASPSTPVSPVSPISPSVKCAACERAVGGVCGFCSFHEKMKSKESDGAHTVVPTDDGWERMDERAIAELKAQLKTAAKLNNLFKRDVLTRSMLPPGHDGRPRWNYTYNGIKYITDEGTACTLLDVYACMCAKGYACMHACMHMCMAITYV